jgi:multidrug efflux pump subunit AcrA (membrane-fusion protein)
MKKVTFLLPLLFGSAILATAATPPSVQTIHPEVRSVSRETQQPANLLALQSASIGTRVDGYISEVLVDIGDSVKAGDVLARIDAPELAAQKQIALAEQSRLTMSMRSAKADLSAVNAEGARIKALVAKKSLSEKVAHESKSKVAAAKANVAAAAAEADIATAKLQAADALLSFTELRAPFDGVVGSLS